MPCFYEKMQTSPQSSRYGKMKRCAMRFNCFYNCLHAAIGFAENINPYICVVIVKQSVHLIKFVAMKRIVNYSVSPRVNPRDREAAPKFYGQIVSNQSVSIEELAEVIAGRCTVKLADVVGVVSAFEAEMKKALLNSEIGELDRSGRFRVTVRGKGAETEEDFSTEHIRGVNVRYAPAKYIKEVLAKANFAKKPLYVREIVVEEDDELLS